MARGDHIYVERLGGLYAHHGIDCGDGNVIHYAGPDPVRCRVRRSSVGEFGKGAVVRLRVCTAPSESDGMGVEPRRLVSWVLDAVAGCKVVRECDVSPEAVVARAESRVGRGGFDPVFNNCEHFATWCRTGVARSRQVEALCSPMPNMMDAIGVPGDVWAARSWF